MRLLKTQNQRENFVYIIMLIVVGVAIFWDSGNIWDGLFTLFLAVIGGIFLLLVLGGIAHLIVKWINKGDEE